MILLLIKLLAGHAFGDYALQGDFIAMYKNRHVRSPTGETIWPYVLTSHALIHGSMVFLITGNIHLGMAETLAHWLIDFGKCEKLFGFHIDQWLHIGCKLLWAWQALNHNF